MESNMKIKEAISQEKSPAFAGLKNQSPDVLFGSLPTPCYILDEAALRRNGELLAGVASRTGCRILLAQKAFSNYDLYPVLSPYLAGTEASGLFEARLGSEKMPGKEVHVFCAAYRENEFEELLRYADHIVFNSPRQLEKFGSRAKKAGKSLGLRINPECSTQGGHGIYDPCSPGSRLGTTRSQWDKKMTPDLVALLDGLHFHTLCEQDADALEVTLNAVKQKFGDILPMMKWLNCGGGHHITKPGYDISRLERCIFNIQKSFGVRVYLEPGEACALNAGFLAARVLDVVENGGILTGILDTSAACHMPDVLEMPYQPPLWGARICKPPCAPGASSAPGSCPPGSFVPDPSAAIAPAGAKTSPSLKVSHGAEGFVYRLGGPTCLAGDVIGDYLFPSPLKEGDLLLFGDMAIYTTCKNNTFNGMPLPDLFVLHSEPDVRLECLRSFGYEDFQGRLGS